jgi:hypothetical protein
MYFRIQIFIFRLNFTACSKKNERSFVILFHKQKRKQFVNMDRQVQTENTITCVANRLLFQIRLVIMNDKLIVCHASFSVYEIE